MCVTYKQITYVLVDVESKIFRVIFTWIPRHVEIPPPSPSLHPPAAGRVPVRQLGRGTSWGWVGGSLGKLNSAAEETALMAEGEAINYLIRGQGAFMASVCVVPEWKSRALSQGQNLQAQGKLHFPLILSGVGVGGERQEYLLKRVITGRLFGVPPLGKPCPSRCVCCLSHRQERHSPWGHRCPAPASPPGRQLGKRQERVRKRQNR